MPETDDRAVLSDDLRTVNQYLVRVRLTLLSHDLCVWHVTFPSCVRLIQGSPGYQDLFSQLDALVVVETESRHVYRWREEAEEAMRRSAL